MSVNTPEIRYMRYDDTWLRELLVSIQIDMREQRTALNAHADEDRDRWDELHACIDKIGDKVDAVQRSIDFVKSAGRSAKWVAGGLVGLGSIIAGLGPSWQWLLDLLRR